MFLTLARLLLCRSMMASQGGFGLFGPHPSRAASNIPDTIEENEREGTASTTQSRGGTGGSKS